MQVVEHPENASTRRFYERRLTQAVIVQNDRDRPIDAAVRKRIAELDAAFPPDKTPQRLRNHMYSILKDAGLPEDLHYITPDDILAYLLSRDQTSHTIVHTTACPAWDAPMHCECPRRAKHDSLKTTVGRLRGVFRDDGMPLPWETQSRMANPANSKAVKHYLAQVALEQRTGNVGTQKAALIDDSIYDLLQRQLLADWAAENEAGNWPAAARTIRLALMCGILWHTGLRLKDAMRLLGQQIRTCYVNQGESLRIQVNVTKSERNDEPFRVIYAASDVSPYSICRLWTLFRHAHGQLGLDISVNRVFSEFRQNPDGVYVFMVPCTERWFQDSFRNYRIRFGLDETASLHSFHGSKAYRDASMGIPREVTCAAIHWSTTMYNRYIANHVPISAIARITGVPNPTRPSHRRRAELYGWELEDEPQEE